MTVPLNQQVFESGLQDAGFPSTATRSPGTQHTFPDGNTVRIMEASGTNPTRAVFENPSGARIDPFTGKQPRVPAGMKGAEARAFTMERSHIELW